MTEPVTVPVKCPVCGDPGPHAEVAASEEEYGPFLPYVTAEGAEQVARAEAWRDALLRRDPWCGFIAPEAP